MSADRLGQCLGHIQIQKDSEFWCPRCGSRCTRSPVDGNTEFGHRNRCPRRPEKFGYATGGQYKPEKDPLLLGERGVAADGGRTTCDDCDSPIDPENHKVLIQPGGFKDLCQQCQPNYARDRLYAPKDGGEQA